MTAITDPTLALPLLAHRLLARFRSTPAALPETPEETRNRRAFVQETITARPGAFESELDVQCMLHMYPGRF